MHEHFAEAIHLAEGVRFSGDQSKGTIGPGTLEASRVHYLFNEHGLRLSSDMTPTIHKVLVEACMQLRMDPTQVLAYVYASPEIQAVCYSADTSDCLISIASGLIELMAEDELAFVIGHELGHFLLGHGAIAATQQPTAEELIRARAREISADRLGILASTSKESAFRALIKTTAGLDDRYLRFDVSKYLEQIRGRRDGSISDGGSSHPSLVLRCRALLWFTISDEYHRLTGGAGGESLARVDERIKADLKAFVDGPAHKRIADAQETFEIWLLASAAIRDGSLDRHEQRLIADAVGDELLDKLLAFLADRGRTEVSSLVRRKLKEAMDFYSSIAPTEYELARSMLERQIADSFNQPDFHQYVIGFVGT